MAPVIVLPILTNYSVSYYESEPLADDINFMIPSDWILRKHFIESFYVNMISAGGWNIYPYVIYNVNWLLGLAEIGYYLNLLLAHS